MTIQNFNQVDFLLLKDNHYLDIRDQNCTIEQIELILSHCNANIQSLSINHRSLSILPPVCSKFSNLVAVSIITEQSLNIDALTECKKIQHLSIESDDIIYAKKNFTFELLSRLSLNIKKLKEIPQFLLSETLVDIYIASTLLNTITDSIFQNLKQLRYLSIQAPIKEMVKLSHCLNLVALNLVFTKLTNLDINEHLPSNLQQLFLIRNELLSEELNFSTLQNLQTLRINTDENIIPIRLIGISCCINLKNLELTFVDNFPDELEKCKKLQAIFINKGNMNSLPDWFVNFEHLANINICQTKLNAVPENWSNLKNLSSLYLNNNKLEDLSFVYTIPKLKYVRFDGNQIKDSLFMLDKGKIFPTYHKEWFEFKALPAKDIPSFMSAIGKSDINRADKEWFFFQFQNQAKFTLPTDWPLYRYFQGLSIPYKLLNQNITNHLIETPQNKQGLDTLVVGSVCFLDGNFTEKKTTIKEKIDKLNIKISTTLNASVTHLIIGQKPTESVLHYQQQETPFLLEYQLYQIIKNVGQEEKFLVQEEIAGDTQMAEGLKQLLGSNDLSSVQIGLEMLKTGGIPDSISEELLLLCKTFNDAKVRAEARKILEVQAQVEWVGVLKDKQTFINISQTKEKDLREKLQKMAATIGKEQVFLFATLLYKYYQKGLAFVLANFALESKERIAALNALTTGDHFDFHKGIGYHNWKNQRPDEIILSSVSTGIAFPSDYPNPKQIKSINMHNCKFETLNKGIEVFENVEELCLSVNNLKALNPSIAKLKNLKVLDLSSNRLTAFPKSVEGLTNLRILDLRYNSQYAYKDGQPISIEIPEWAKEKLSNCEILI